MPPAEGSEDLGSKSCSQGQDILPAACRRHQEQRKVEGSSTASSTRDTAGQPEEGHDGVPDRSVAEPASPSLTEEQQARMLDSSEALKAEGNALYAKQDFLGAANKYADAVEAGESFVARMAWRCWIRFCKEVASSSVR